MRPTNLLLTLMLLLTGCKCDIDVIEDNDLELIIVTKRSKITGELIDNPKTYYRKYKDIANATD